MPESLNERIRRYVNPQAPLGPSDAAQIKDIEVAAHLFDRHNDSFTSLLRKDLSVVIGRRGSGKTALLNSYKYRPYFGASTSREQETLGSDFSAYDIVIEIATHKKFEEMQRRVVKDPDVFRPIESIVEDWEKLILDYFLAMLLSEASADKQPDVHLSTIHVYLRQDESQLRDEVRKEVWGDSLWSKFNALWREKKTGIEYVSQSQAIKEAEKYLVREKKRAVIMFDSMDEYGIGNFAFDRTVGALLRFVDSFNKGSDRIKIKLVLPSEIFPEIQKASGNPLKDLVSFDQVQWSVMDLMQIAAFRYHRFLSLYDPDCLQQLGRLDLMNRRDDVHKFWDRFFPKAHKNRYGVEEKSMTYVLRHTQLLPRQLLMILQTIVIDSHRLTGGYRQFDSETIRKAIEKMEPIIAGEIFTAFRAVYKFADDIGRAVFGNCPTILSYDQLEDRWRKKARHQMSKLNAEFEMVHFSDMLVRMGIIGLIVEEAETERYHQGQFGYGLLTPFNIGGGNQLCIHPIFSKYFNASRNAKSKAILPQGVD